MATFSVILLTFALIGVCTTTADTNITEILSAYPEYSEFNNLLTQTKVADEINSRQTITVLVLNNGNVTALAAKKPPLSVVKTVLSLHVLLDYFDKQKLQDISGGSVISTSLYQTTGKAQGLQGFVNITDLKGGEIAFGSAVSGSALASVYTKSIKEIPYNISVIEISGPIIAPGILTPPPCDTCDQVNVTASLEEAGCKTFAALISNTGLLKVFQKAMSKGLTVFAPSDVAFTAKGLPDLSKLTNAEVLSLLQYHALAFYSPIGTLKCTKAPIQTIATGAAGKYELTVQRSGDSVSLLAGLDSARLDSTLVDSPPFVLFTIDNVLLPKELFGKPPSPSPSPGTVPSPTPAPWVPSPAPKSATPPSPYGSPPAPPVEAPSGSPADAPGSESQDSSADKNGARVKVPAFFMGLVTVAVSAIFSVLLS